MGETVSDRRQTYRQEAAAVASEFLDRDLLEDDLRREVSAHLARGEPLEALTRIRNARDGET